MNVAAARLLAKAKVLPGRAKAKVPKVKAKTAAKAMPSAVVVRPSSKAGFVARRRR
jgi:hypothetical protein